MSDNVEKATDATADFQKGVRAVFDYFKMRAANNYHSNSKIQAILDKENSVALSWINDALAEVGPEDYTTWKSLLDMYNDGYAAGKRSNKPDLK